MLRERLIARQRELGLSDREFAQLLGVPRSTWQLTRAGRKRVGPRIARAIIKAFPDLAPEAISFLLTDATTRTNGASVCTPAQEV